MASRGRIVCACLLALTVTLAQASDALEPPSQYGALEPPRDRRTDFTIVGADGKRHTYNLPETTSLGALHSYHNAMTGEAAPSESFLHPGPGHTGDYDHTSQLKDFDTSEFHVADRAADADRPDSWAKVEDWRSAQRDEHTPGDQDGADATVRDFDGDASDADAGKATGRGGLGLRGREDVGSDDGGSGLGEDDSKDDVTVHGPVDPSGLHSPLMPPSGAERVRVNVVHGGRTFHYDVPSSLSLGTLHDLHRENMPGSGSLLPAGADGQPLSDTGSDHTTSIDEAGTRNFVYSEKKSNRGIPDYSPPSVGDMDGDRTDPYAFMRGR